MSLQGLYMSSIRVLHTINNVINRSLVERFRLRDSFLLLLRVWGWSSAKPPPAAEFCIVWRSILCNRAGITRVCSPGRTDIDNHKMRLKHRQKSPHMHEQASMRMNARLLLI